jgi:hypothetical protein
MAAEDILTAVKEHIADCNDPKQLRDRVGTCTNDGEQVNYGQTECPHAVLLLGTCESCGTNYDRGGWKQAAEEG